MYLNGRSTAVQRNKRRAAVRCLLKPVAIYPDPDRQRLLGYVQC